MPLRFDSFLAGGGGIPPPSDPHFANVVFLSGFEGADESTTITDESAAAHAMTAQGNAQIDTAQFKFGASSLLLDGTGDFVTSPDSADWTMPGECTVDAWFRLAAGATGTHTIMSHYDTTSSNRAWQSTLNLDTDEVKFTISLDGASNTVALLSIMLNTEQWYFIRGIRDASNVLKVAVDGVVGGTTPTLSGMKASNSLLRVGTVFSGGSEAGLFNGWLGECRITKGVARDINELPGNAFPRE